DCEELYVTGHTQSGIYVIRPDNSPELVVYCEMDYDCSGWTTIQKNSDNTEITWTEAWTTYKYGFGNIEADHWLGNEYTRRILQQKLYKVRVLLWDANNNHRYAEYDSFMLDDEAGSYRLRLGAYEGNAGDSLSATATNTHDNSQFSTKDNDNDQSTKNCAKSAKGGWWYDDCYSSQLNRQIGLHWETLCDHNCKRSKILIKPVN
uniref:Fibrinogen C-terminal domain-containing protein n=2 Tax=Latimeria chalumnae TaxID=7897 RepID=H3ATP6_LATCH